MDVSTNKPLHVFCLLVPVPWPKYSEYDDFNLLSRSYCQGNLTQTQPAPRKRISRKNQDKSPKCENSDKLSILVMDQPTQSPMVKYLIPSSNHLGERLRTNFHPITWISRISESEFWSFHGWFVLVICFWATMKTVLLIRDTEQISSTILDSETEFHLYFGILLRFTFCQDQTSKPLYRVEIACRGFLTSKIALFRVLGDAWCVFNLL